MKKALFLDRFGSKIDVARNKNDTCFLVFALFRVFLSCNPLQGSHYRRSGPFIKNHTKKPTVGFSVFGDYGNIFIVRLKLSMDDVVAEEVGRQVAPNRQLTQINTTFGERDRPGRCGPRPATRSETQERYRDVFDQTPNTPAKMTALPTHQISPHWRLFASIGGLMRQFWRFQPPLTQLVDFHVYFTYFHLEIPPRHQENREAPIRPSRC